MARKNNYYAIVCGRIAPAICSSWGTTQALVDGYPKSNFQGFRTLNEAVLFMSDYPDCKYFCGRAEGERAPKKGDLVYYAVANGKHVGVYEFYKGGAREEITKFSHSCYKAFASREEAEDFIKENKVTADLVKRMPVGKDIGTILDGVMSQLRL